MPSRYPIEHVVVLMLENGSFDHMFGFLPHGGELAGNEFNLMDPANPASERVTVTRRATFRPPVEPPHDLVSVSAQLFGPQGAPVDPAPMTGFVAAALQATGDAAQARAIMDCFDPANLPTFTALAREFCLCTRWFSSVPGPTWPNRLFVHAATSDGVAGNDLLHDYDMPTIFNRLAEHGLTWNVYFHDIPQALALHRLRPFVGSFRHFEHFRDDVAAGRLPAYTFIEPRYFNFLDWHANDGHPPHDVRYAEALAADVYAALRGGPQWEQTLLAILFDEHGGYYDHVPPPGRAAVPDGKTSTEPPFDFARLGVRVPALLVSPWVPRGLVDATPYDHTSLLATIKELFGLPAYLTRRDAAAGTFLGVLSERAPRTDTPMTVPVPEPPAEPAVLPAFLTPSHLALLGLARRLSLVPAAAQGAAAPGPAAAAAPAAAGPVSEDEAAALVHQAMATFLADSLDEGADLP